MPLKRKVLWVVWYDRDPESFKQHVIASGCDTVCIRTWSDQLKSAISMFHGLQPRITVWAWRWPGADPDPVRAKGPHYYAPLEADFVADELIPAGLDGYVVDPESNDDQDVNDWNRVEVKGAKLADLARNFWATIKAKAPAGFHFGITSGHDFPNDNQKPLLPWAEFIGPCAAIYPQTYIRITGDDGKPHEPRGTLDHAVTNAFAAYKRVALGKPIIPMAGEIDLLTADDIRAYGAKLAALGIQEGHFYADVPWDPVKKHGVSPEVLAAIKLL